MKKIIVWVVFMAMACDMAQAASGCARGKQMQQSAANGATNEMNSADALFNNLKNSFDNANSVCFSAIRSLNISGSIPPIPVPSAVGGIVSGFLNNVVNNKLNSTCTTITSNLVGTMSGNNSLNSVLPGGIGRLTGGSLPSMPSVQGAIGSVIQQTTGSTSTPSTSLPVNPTASQPTSSLPSALTNLFK